jgi:hypothetical protein
MQGSLPALPHCKGTCLRILHDMLGMKKVHLRLVSYALDTNLAVEKVTLLHEVLSALSNIRSAAFQSVITEDESWFFRYYPRDSIWALSGDEVPERVSQKRAQKSV